MKFFKFLILAFAVFEETEAEHSVFKKIVPRGLPSPDKLSYEQKIDKIHSKI